MGTYRIDVVPRPGVTPSHADDVWIGKGKAFYAEAASGAEARRLVAVNFPLKCETDFKISANNTTGKG